MKTRTVLFSLGILTVLAALSGLRPGAHSAAAEFDLVLSRGRIVDGTGNPWFEADLAIKDGRIAAIGRVEASRAARAIDARGLIVAPGFIDVHTHIESGIEQFPAAENFLQMGVTSVVTGNCGTSALHPGEWFGRLEKQGVSLNVATLIGHNTVRHAGMNGDFDRPPTAEELRKMRGLVEQAMREGAVGFSTGLEYIPGTYGKTDEIAALAREAARFGGLYATHMRDEGEVVEQSIRESLQIGALAGCPVEISHFKISSRKRWGASEATIRLVEDARARGQQVTVDQYVYPAGSTGLGILFPSWVFEGGAEKTRERLTRPDSRARVHREVIAKAAAQGFADFSFAVVTSHSANPAFNGKSIVEIAKMAKDRADLDSQAEQVIELQLAGGAGLVLHKMADEDIDRIFRQPFTMIASDAGVPDPGGASVPHPRGFGNNARVLGLYVREKRLTGLEEAVRKMTSLPAQTFHLWDRGLLRPGMAADLVVFDEKTIADRATFQAPKQAPVGIAFVLVNGQPVVEAGKHTGARAGRLLRNGGPGR